MKKVLPFVVLALLICSKAEAVSYHNSSSIAVSSGYMFDGTQDPGVVLFRTAYHNTTQDTRLNSRNATTAKLVQIPKGAEILNMRITFLTSFNANLTVGDWNSSARWFKSINASSAGRQRLWVLNGTMGVNTIGYRYPTNNWITLTISKNASGGVGPGNATRIDVWYKMGKTVTGEVQK